MENLKYKRTISSIFESIQLLPKKIKCIILLQKKINLAIDIMRFIAHVKFIQ